MTISEVSGICELSPDTLRYYERIGLLSPVKRQQSGNRNYDDEDLRRIDFVKCMRSVSMPIEVLIEYLELYQQGDTTVENRREILMSQRKQLIKKVENIQKVIERLDGKIDRYGQILQENSQV